MKKKILIIDDENFMRTHFGNLIRKMGFDVIVAEDAQEAVSNFHLSNPDIVFLDIRLPDINGEKIFNILKQMKMDVKIFFVSGSEEELKKVEALKLGAEGYLPKPIFSDQIEAALKPFI
jgi:two-component system, OmpR family, response regulator RpaB